MKGSISAKGKEALNFYEKRIKELEKQLAEYKHTPKAYKTMEESMLASDKENAELRKKMEIMYHHLDYWNLEGTKIESWFDEAGKVKP